MRRDCLNFPSHSSPPIGFNARVLISCSPACCRRLSPCSACLHGTECVFFSPSPALWSACSIDRWLHFLLRVHSNSLSLTCVQHSGRVVLECRQRVTSVHPPPHENSIISQRVVFHGLDCGNSFKWTVTVINLRCELASLLFHSGIHHRAWFHWQ